MHKLLKKIEFGDGSAGKHNGKYAAAELALNSQFRVASDDARVRKSGLQTQKKIETNEPPTLDTTFKASTCASESGRYHAARGPSNCTALNAALPCESRRGGGSQKK
jgi:hypothetical protein